MLVALSPPSENGSLARFHRVMLVAWAILFFAACTDGYPTEDELVINPLAGFESGRQTFEMQLSGAGISISFNKTDQVYGVQVPPREGESLEKPPILLSKTWVDAIEMGNLVRSFQIGCQMSATTELDNQPEPS